MAAQRRFEGNTLAEVLAKVQKEMGSDVKILSAQRARTGGLLGFFQREKFEVIVEVPDPNAPKPVPAAPSPAPEPAPAIAAPDTPIAPTPVEATTPAFAKTGTEGEPDDAEVANSILDLVQRISESERKHEAEAPLTPPPAKRAERPPVAVQPVEEVDEEPIPEVKPRSEVIKADRVELPEEVSAPEISTLTDSFAEVLSRVAFQADMQSDNPKAEESASVIELEDNRDDNDILEDDDVFEDSDVDEFDDEGFDDEEEVEAEEPVVTPRVPHVITEPLIADRPAFLDTPTASAEPVETAATVKPAATPTPAPKPEPVTAAPEPAAVPEPVAPAETSGIRPTPAFRTRVSDHPLATLGLPVSLIPAGVEPAQLQKALAASLERLPKPPEVHPSKGSIIAIVGEVVEAIQLAEQLAQKWKRPPEEIVLASQAYKGRGADAVLRNVRSAEDARRSWRRRPRPTIVAIDAYPGSRDTAWAEHMLTALEPIATYGVADATRKAEDIAAWASQLGGIDCLAVNHLDETVSPASILATGIPVERIDGRAATPAFWAMLLAERLSAA